MTTKVIEAALAGGGLVVPRSWHENSGYQKLEEEGMVQMRTVRGRRRESNLSLASDSEVYGACSEERMISVWDTAKDYITVWHTTKEWVTAWHTAKDWVTVWNTA